MNIAALKLLRHAFRLQCIVQVILMVSLSPRMSVCGEIESDLAEKISHLGTRGKTGIIVKLRQGVGTAGLDRKFVRHSKRERRTAVAGYLREENERLQQGTREYLREKTRNGFIDGFTALWVINGFSLSADAATIREISLRPEVENVAVDRVVTMSKPLPAAAASAMWNIDATGAPAMWSRGFTGQGVVVATLDTGVDINHAALGTKWRGGSNSWFDPYTHSTAPYDVNGHGTGVMGIISGGDVAGVPIGVAPGVIWIAAKIFDDGGTATVSVIHQAFQWLLNPDGNNLTDDAPDIVNLSWILQTGGGCSYDQEYIPDVDALKTAGIAVVSAAGNAGPLPSSSCSPANYPGMLSVGATDISNVISTYSSRGPAPDSSTFPALTAPGTALTTAGLTLNGSFQNTVVSVSGTSYAAPHVSGAMALLLSANPNLTVSQLEGAVKQSAFDLGTAGVDNAYGYGFLAAPGAAAYLRLISPVLPSGDVDGSGSVTAVDALLVLRAVVGSGPVSTAIMNDGDVAPYINGLPVPDRRIELQDALVVLQKAVRLLTW
jgi:serine protease AprX